MPLVILLLLTLNLYAERIIALSPAIAEILFAVGRGSEVVGVSDHTVFPKEAAALPKVGGYFQPNIETMLSLQPTRIIGQSNHTALLQQLQHLHVTTQKVNLEHIDSIIETMAQLGHHSAQAQARIAAIRATQKRYTDTVSSQRVLIVFGLVSDLRDPIYVSGPNLFFNEIITLCGASNAVTATLPKQPVLTYETLIALNPDTVLILNAHPAPDADKALQAWYDVPIAAAKNGRILVLNDDFITIPSHRIAQSIATICEALQ
ncbi:MAG: ABC transporter substrate-binding protein [Sulfurimonas sp.]|nr:MAG: ABC transporter substrate-binding protein [Sulfurimonas sp.]